MTGGRGRGRHHWELNDWTEQIPIVVVTVVIGLTRTLVVVVEDDNSLVVLVLDNTRVDTDGQCECVIPTLP